MQNRNQSRKRGVAGIAANLGNGAEGADGTELLKNISIAQQDGFILDWMVERLMCSDGGCDGVELFGRKTQCGKEFSGAGNRIGNMVPVRNFCRIGGAMTHKDTQIMHPRCSEEDIVVEVQSLTNAAGESVKPWLMAKFIDGTRFYTDVLDY